MTQSFILSRTVRKCKRGRPARGNPDSYDVLVLDASDRQSLATVRSLGRAGLRVAVAESDFLVAEGHGTPAFRSRYSAYNLVLPHFAEAEAFASAVLQFVDIHPVRVIVPAREGSISALLPRRKKLATLGCTLALASDASLAIANDKDLTLEAARELSIPCPDSVPVSNIDEVRSSADRLGLPMVLKPTVSWPGAERVAPVEVGSVDEAIAQTERFIATGARVLAQQLLPGRREGVTLFIADGEVMAAFAHAEHRTIPPLGGISVLRESIELSPDIVVPSTRLARAIGLDGLCEVEFRRDAENRPQLMEINARPAGTMEIAVLCGVDLPLMMWQLATGSRVNSVKTYRPGIRMRWLYGELRWLVENNASAGRSNTVSRQRALWRFCSEFVRTRHYDSVDLRDLRPTVIDLLNTIWFVRRFLMKQLSRSDASSKTIVSSDS